MTFVRGYTAVMRVSKFAGIFRKIREDYTTQSWPDIVYASHPSQDGGEDIVDVFAIDCSAIGAYWRMGVGAFIGEHQVYKADYKPSAPRLLGVKHSIPRKRARNSCACGECAMCEARLRKQRSRRGDTKGMMRVKCGLCGQCGHDRRTCRECVSGEK